MNVMYKKLSIWVEGDRDRRFFENIIEPLFYKSFDKVEILEYRCTKTQTVNTIIRKTKGQNDYIFTKDMDFPTCMGRKKDSIIKKYPSIISNKIIIVKKDIEGWYLAGLSNETCKELGLKPHSTTDDVTKSEFNSIRPKEFDSDIDFRMEILRNYDIDLAKTKNKSLRYFLKKYEEAIS